MTRIVGRSAVIVFLIALIASPLWAGGNKEQEEQQTPQTTEEQSQEAAADQDDAATDDTTQITMGEPVARVNGVDLYKSEFDELVAGNLQRAQAQGQQLNPQQEAQLKQQILQGMITREILEQKSAELGIEVTQAEYEQQLQQVRSQFESELAFEMALEQEGFSKDSFEQELRRQMRIQKLIQQQVYDEINVTTEQAQAFYEENPDLFEQGDQVAARHILISTQELESDEDIAEARGRAEGIRAELVDGADFAELAQEKSEGPSASRGGDLGTFGRGQMVAPFEEAAFNLEVGEISDIVETQFGFHIIEVTEKIQAQTQSFEDSQERIVGFLTEQERNAAAQQYVAALQEEADIERLIDISAPQLQAQPQTDTEPETDSETE